jgi:hypothetical protein
MTAMKQILPILTLTTLTAAAFADAGAAAPAAALHRVYPTTALASAAKVKTITSPYRNLIGGSNVLVTLSTDSSYDGGNSKNNYAHLSLGYVFKNVISGIDATVSVGQGDR